MCLLKRSSRVVHLPSNEELAKITDEDIAKHIAKPGAARRFIERMESGKIRHVCWDMDISYEEFKARVEAGYYDKKDEE